MLIINDEEARQLSHEYSLVKAAKVIREMGPKYLIIKKGEHGALLFHNENIFFAPALPLEEVLIQQVQATRLLEDLWGISLQQMMHRLRT